MEQGLIRLIISVPGDGVSVCEHVLGRVCVSVFGGGWMLLRLSDVLFVSIKLYVIRFRATKLANMQACTHSYTHMCVQAQRRITLVFKHAQ